jgi:hypothetical protein
VTRAIAANREDRFISKARFVGDKHQWLLELQVVLKEI